MKVKINEARLDDLEFQRENRVRRKAALDAKRQKDKLADLEYRVDRIERFVFEDEFGYNRYDNDEN